MTIEKTRLLNLRDVEGKISPHQGQLDRALRVRAEALSFVNDVGALARFMGAKIEVQGCRGDWCIVKEIFPGVKIHFVFEKADEEFPARLKALFSGKRLELMSGEDLVSLMIPIVSHMLRYVREANPDKKLPEVCYRV
ncbi:MAG: DUF3786 domain-containing protein [Dehalococcoidia bacterium]|nr:DUF3786 domain-containing protein [Dehalococcoidia bacterium]